jgi:hypothetical protein
MSAKSFTERQGQYLAFIDAYTRVHGRPPAETDMQRSARLPRTRWSSRWSASATSAASQASRSIEVLLAPEDLPVLRHPQPVKSTVPRN